MSAAKKAKTEPVFPDIPAVEKPLLQALATVCAKLYDPKLNAVFTPKVAPENNMLEQPYELSKKGGEYTVKPAITGGEDKVIKGHDIFNHDIKHTDPADDTASLAEYGKVIHHSFTDFHGEFGPAYPPFAFLVVQPKDDPKDPILIFAWRGSITAFDWTNDAACSPTLSTRWSGQTPDTPDILAHAGFFNLVENTFSRHEDKIVAKIVDIMKDYPKVKRAFFTGHSLGGGVANVAHLVVRGQLKKEGSPWAKLDGKLEWFACTFAAPQTIVRLYNFGEVPPLANDLDDSSYNIVIGCDAAPRLPGMLKFMGDLVEKVLPVAAKKELKELIPVYNWAAGMIANWLVNHELDPDEIVRSLKEKGIAEVLGQYTHQGTVVYLAPGALEYKQLKGAEIAKTLDVNGEAFDKLVGGKGKFSDWLSIDRKAHSAAYNTLMFKVN